MTNEPNNHQYWMQYAIEEAAKAEALGEVPVGAVLVKDNQIIASAHNLSIAAHDACGHAEIRCIQSAGEKIQNYRIGGTLYVTLEPCPMCAGALVHARVEKVVFGAKDLKTGAAGSVMNLLQHPNLNHQLAVEQGVLADECAEQISNFFKRRRAEKKALKLAQKANQQ
ncbi:tRNA adenosine(34) deaminase TadA [Paraferrimonas sp. SM1919]|uniref:tRNA adenosine(34) deaminase TadA n=1 Tax=Paraferrimonas sp. SM1919 TaxID=2662263 RepID=UPI0013D3ECE6|nr:tRNA adenosine(34) deaminase TadA [Paraferrimonas sp. SM1919]